MERPPIRLLLPAGAALLVVLGAVLWWRTASPDGGELSERARPPWGAGVHIRVEVLNTTRTSGLARRATMALRDAGFDVVRYASDTGNLDSTLVLDRSGHPEWAERVARALDASRVASRPDSSRYLDVTVLLGADWRPPSKPFHP